MEIQRVISGAPWENKVGYCRAIKIGNIIAVSGTAAVNASGQVVGIANPPATTMLEVLRLINSDFLIEVEADAYCTNK